jgi:putative transcriptional regulator
VLRVIGRPNGPSRWLVALGYAGWGAGQLDNELHRHGWHIATGDDALVFDQKTEDRWTGAFRCDGIDPALLASASGNA